MALADFYDNLSKPGSARHLAAVRILMGTYLVTQVFLSPSTEVLGVLRGRHHQLAQTWFPPALESFLWSHYEALVAGGVIAGTLLTIGLLTRLSTVVTLIFFLATQDLWFRVSLFHNDWLYYPVPLLLLCFAPAGDAWSVDALLRRRPLDRAPHHYRWPLELCIAWLGFVYIAAGLAKVLPLDKGVAWMTGTTTHAFSMIFMRDSPIFHLLGGPPFDYYDNIWVWQLANVATVVIEVGAAAFVLWPTWRVRFGLMTTLMAFHVTIWFLAIPGFVSLAGVFWIGLFVVRPEWFGDLPQSPQSKATKSLGGPTVRRRVASSQAPSPNPS